jgi:diadenosine tetraphosphate (Ap4A) HIT family hydrolase
LADYAAHSHSNDGGLLLVDTTEFCQNCRRQHGLEQWQPLASSRSAMALVFRFQRTPGEILVISRRQVTGIGQMSLDEGTDFYAPALASVCALAEDYYFGDSTEGVTSGVNSIHA